MPELAEVDYYRKQWNCGMGGTIAAVSAHPRKRIFRGVALGKMLAAVPGTSLLMSESHGKRMLFRFSNDLWLGLHLGMTGKLRVEAPGFKPSQHDHLVLKQEPRSLVFSDPRLFGRVSFHQGASAPHWWSDLPPSPISTAFTQDAMEAFLERHSKVPIKAALLMQDGFPGIGNWMADEILWRAKLNPRTLTGAMARSQVRKLWAMTRFVSLGAMDHISHDFSDPPGDWFFHQRWQSGGNCPVDSAGLIRETVGGRTTAWCPKCQRMR